MKYFLFNYMDDFIGVEHCSRIWESFNSLIRTFRDIGIKESVSKRVSPTQVLNCVGTLINSKDRTMAILPERKVEIFTELEYWSSRNRCCLKDIQKLVGKLQFICAVVRPGRIFLSRMLEFLRTIKPGREEVIP